MTETEMFIDLKSSTKGVLEVLNIETGTTGLGVPDVFYTGNGFSGWIELKQSNELKFEYRTKQRSWLKKHSYKKLNGFVLFHNNKTYYLLNKFDKEKFLSIEELKEYSI